MSTLTSPLGQSPLGPPHHSQPDLLAPLRNWLDQIEIKDRKLAHLLCRIIPCTCPFERRFTLFGHTYHIPPLCKLNPLYNEVVYLRFRALAYLSDICGEDVNSYIC
jgi:Mo-dependent nitrogenase C-terminus